jgi:serine/threonine protein kinase
MDDYTKIIENDIRLLLAGYEDPEDDDTYPVVPVQPSADDIKYISGNYHEMKVTQDTALFVNPETGEILGPQGEGTLAIVLYGGSPESKNSKTSRLETERAVRIPRLLQSDMLLNYHIAEISFYEGKHASRYTGDHHLLSATAFHNLTDPVFTRMPGETHRKPCYVGFYLSPGSKYKICLLSKENAWPKAFDDYVNAEYAGASNLFSEIEQSLKTLASSEMNRLIFLPCPENYEALSEKEEEHLITLGRHNLSQRYENKEANGWWFNLPIAAYPWMSADLQRLLTGYLDEDREHSNSFKGLSGWHTDSWLSLVQDLAEGLMFLHQKRGIHGDIRPANIMTNVYEDRDLLPDQFKWIDIGLAGDEFTEFSDDEKTAIVPRPLGEERKTPFYAPERNDILEFEDADKIRIKQDENGIRLSFLWRERTFDDAAYPLRIRSGSDPIRELGKLRKGDRIQVREFLFDIEEIISETEIRIQNIYEVGFERLLIQKTGDALETVIRRLDRAAISRYKIFRQWSQATDIYGFGVIFLYLFYMKGLHHLKIHKDSEKEDPQTGVSDLVFNRLRRERTFEEFISLLRSQSFLEIFLNILWKKGIENTDAIWELDQESAETEKLSAIVDTIVGLDATSELVLYGADGSYRLFIQILYIALCCLWRQDEADDIVRSAAITDAEPDTDIFEIPKPEQIPEYHRFTPFCEDRFKIRKGELEKPAKALKKAIDRIIDQKHKNVILPDQTRLAVNRGSTVREIGVTWQKRITTLNQEVRGMREERTRLNQELSKLQHEFAKLKQYADKTSQEHAAAKQRADKAVQENEKLKQRVNKLTQENILIKQSVDSEHATIRQSRKEFVEESERLKTRECELTTANASLEQRIEELMRENRDLLYRMKSVEAKKDTLIREIAEKCSLIESEEPFPTAFTGYKKGYVNRFFRELNNMLREKGAEG